MNQIVETKKYFYKLNLTICIVFSWITFHKILPVGLIWCVVLSAYFLRKKEFRYLSFLIAGSPYLAVPLITSILAVTSYFTGQATFKHSGYPALEFFNLNAEYRCYNKPSGCIVTDAEQFWQIPNNLILKGMIKTFGPMKGAYTDFYPTGKESFYILNSSISKSFIFNSKINDMPDELKGYFNTEKLWNELNHRFKKEHGNNQILKYYIINARALLAGSEEVCVLYDLMQDRCIARYRYGLTDYYKNMMTECAQINRMGFTGL